MKRKFKIQNNPNPHQEFFIVDSKSTEKFQYLESYGYGLIHFCLPVENYNVYQMMLIQERSSNIKKMYVSEVALFQPLNSNELRVIKNRYSAPHSLSNPVLAEVIEE